jgi:hypothetical protein
VASPLQQRKKSPETKTFTIPNRKEKSTRRKHPKTNKSGQAANTKRLSKLPKKISGYLFLRTNKNILC